MAGLALRVAGSGSRSKRGRESVPPQEVLMWIYVGLIMSLEPHHSAMVAKVKQSGRAPRRFRAPRPSRRSPITGWEEHQAPVYRYSLGNMTRGQCIDAEEIRVYHADGPMLFSSHTSEASRVLLPRATERPIPHTILNPRASRVSPKPTERRLIVKDLSDIRHRRVGAISHGK